MAVSWVFLMILSLFAILLVGGVAAFAAGSRSRENRGERHQSPEYEGQRPRSVLGLILGMFLALAVGSVVLVVVFGTFRFRRSHVTGEIVRAEASRALVLSDPLSATAQSPVAVKRSTSDVVASEIISYEKLWDRLTEARIDLGDEPESDPPAETETKTRPEWVDEPPKPVGEDYKVVVESDPFVTVDGCFVQLEQRFYREIERRLTELVPSDQHSLVDSESVEATGITFAYIMREICQEWFPELVELSVGAMRKVHVLMVFTTDVDKHLLQSWQGQLRRHRLTSVSLIAGGILAVLATLYGMLQFDTWTLGYYTKRLLWGVPAAIIAVATVVLLNFA